MTNDFMQKEAPQSLESQLKMARPKRAEVKRVPLTPEEKEFLGKIMAKAVAAEKAGKLKEALDFYIDYKNELFKIKERIKEEKRGGDRKEQELIWTKEKLEKWVEKVFGPPEKGTTIEKMTANMFNLSKLPKLETQMYLYLLNKVIDEFPAMTVNGNLNLVETEIKKWIGSGLIIKGDCDFTNTKIQSLPEGTHIECDVHFNNSSIDLPNELYIDGDVFFGYCDLVVSKKIIKLKKQILKLKAEGKIKGRIIE